MAAPRGEEELVRTLRAALLAVEETRGDLLKLAARTFAVMDEMRALLRDQSAEALAALDAAIEQREASLLEAYRTSDLDNPGRLQLGDPEDKYQVDNSAGPPCAELIPICGGRCCSFEFALSTQDLDEGVIQWDRGHPYLIRHDADGFCTHQDRGTRGCTAYHHRPGTCREFDCRKDPRIWTDYERRILAPLGVPNPPAWSTPFNLLDRARRHQVALAFEALSLRKRVDPNHPPAAEGAADDPSAHPERGRA